MSIIIHNFSLAYDSWSPTEDLGVLSVDVIDTVYNIVVSGTHFYYNDVLVSGTFTPITDGYTISYSPGTITSGIDVMVHAENDNGDTEEETYNMLYGLNVEWTERIRWNPAQQIDVHMAASNEVMCPNDETEAFYYTTRDLLGSDFTAKVFPVVPQYFTGSIRPQSTTFFYGSTYTITVSGIKDFSGNIMEPYTYSFTIDDPTRSG